MFFTIKKEYGFGGKLLKAVESFFVHSTATRACVRVGNDVSECRDGK